MSELNNFPKLSNSSFSYKDLTINPKLVLAPMSGVTNSAFRRLIKELNPNCVGLMISEFISVEGLTRNSKRSMEMMKFRESERPFGIQIFGYDTNRIVNAALMAQDVGADIVDLNCGCPAPKVVKRGGGCELMRQPEHLAGILHKTRKAIKLPFTLKMRSGWDDSCVNAAEIARIAESEGLDGIAIHGRTRAQMYRGEADWSIAAAISTQVKIPVSGSGDVTDRNSALKKLALGNFAGLFIGRAAIENPYVFSDICDLNKEGRKSVKEILMRYTELLKEDHPDKFTIGKLKQIASQIAKNLPLEKRYWVKDFCRALKLEDQLSILNSIDE